MSTTTRSTRPSDPAAGSAHAELRRDRRARAAWPARLLSKAGVIVGVTVCDVSEGGMGLIGATTLPLGTVLDITLSVPSASGPTRTHAVRANVRVMFSSFVGTQCRIGVQFIELPMPARIALRSYVMAHS